MLKSRIALTSILLFFGMHAFALEIEVGSIADSRFETGWTLDGSAMTSTRLKLLTASNFGQLGTVGQAINITDVSGPINLTALSTFDVFFIGYLRDSHPNAFSAGELQAFQVWVEAGGTMVITCDEPGYAAVCDAFGPLPGGTAAPPVNPTGAAVSHPLFDGPFGTPAALNMAGSRQYFTDIAGFTVLGEDQNDRPVVLERLIGSGRVVLFTDVDIISDDTLSAGAGIVNDNDRFLGNLFAYLAEQAGETFLINAGLNGNWWYGPDRSGEGVQLEVVYSGGNLTVVATFYTYDTSGNQVFLVAVGNVTGNVANVDVYITEGGLWGVDFDPDLIDETQWGTGTFTASNCNGVHMSLSPNAEYQALGFTNLAYELVRLTVPAAPCPISNPVF